MSKYREQSFPNRVNVFLWDVLYISRSDYWILQGLWKWNPWYVQSLLGECFDITRDISKPPDNVLDGPEHL